MDIQLRNLRNALQRLEELPNAEIVKGHSTPSTLASVIKDETVMSRKIIKDIIELVEETTFQLRIDRAE